jgi:hypothetical protein
MHWANTPARPWVVTKAHGGFVPQALLRRCQPLPSEKSSPLSGLKRICSWIAGRWAASVDDQPAGGPPTAGSRAAGTIIDSLSLDLTPRQSEGSKRESSGGAEHQQQPRH